MTTTRKPKATRPAREVMLSVRVPRELVRLLDEERDRLAAERPGATVTRADALRETIYRALGRSMK